MARSPIVLGFHEVDLVLLSLTFTIIASIDSIDDDGFSWKWEWTNNAKCADRHGAFRFGSGGRRRTLTRRPSVVSAGRPKRFLIDRFDFFFLSSTFFDCYLFLLPEWQDATCRRQRDRNQKKKRKIKSNLTVHYGVPQETISITPLEPFVCPFNSLDCIYSFFFDLLSFLRLFPIAVRVLCPPPPRCRMNDRKMTPDLIRLNRGNWVWFGAFKGTLGRLHQMPFTRWQLTLKRKKQVQ